MPKFKVYLQRYVEEIGEIVVNANDEDEARNIALRDADMADWCDGSDSRAVEAYEIRDAADALVWER